MAHPHAPPADVADGAYHFQPQFLDYEGVLPEGNIHVGDSCVGVAVSDSKSSLASMSTTTKVVCVPFERPARLGTIGRNPKRAWHDMRDMRIHHIGLLERLRARCRKLLVGTISFARRRPARQTLR
jgi:hypothetical protein